MYIYIKRYFRKCYNCVMKLKIQLMFCVMLIVGDCLIDEELEDILQSIDLDVDYEGNIKYEGKVKFKGKVKGKI